MSLNTFVKIVIKAFKFAVRRPIQRFNIYNRAKNYLGPDAKYFTPAPRAIGPMSNDTNAQAKFYPHLQKGYKSIEHKRKVDFVQDSSDKLRSFSETERDDKLVIGVSNKLEVTKNIVKINPESEQKTIAIGEVSRPLPKNTKLQLQDPAVIWQVNQTPKGRLNLDMLQEIMINKLADDQYWTPKVISDKYSIREEFADKLVKYMKQIRIVVSPRMLKQLDYTGKNNPVYQSTKHLVYHVDKRLRTEVDKQYDETFLPTEQLDEEVKQLLEPPMRPKLPPTRSELPPVKPKGEIDVK